jgi:hypothetical protein
MAHGLAWIAFLALCCVAVHRWTHDFRAHVTPWLKRRSNVAADSWLSVLAVAVSIFAPVAGLWIAAHFRAISWTMAYPLLFLALSVSCLVWVAPLLRKDGSR